MRAALYTRVSTSQQENALQLDELRQVATQRGYAVVEYADVASGVGNLPARERLLADARAGKLDVVLVWRFDRFGRSLRDLLDALENFREWGVEFASLRDSVDTSTPAGKLVFTVIGALAEFERTLIVERVHAGIAAARRRGKRVGRPRRAFDHDRARAMLDAGVAVKATARALGVSPRTLRRQLGRGRNPPSQASFEVTEITVSSEVDGGGGVS